MATIYKKTDFLSQRALILQQFDAATRNVDFNENSIPKTGNENTKKTFENGHRFSRNLARASEIWDVPLHGFAV